jgi:hypothetical protein
MRNGGIIGLALVAVWACLFAHTAADDGEVAWLTDADAAFRVARQHNRPILAVLH